MNRTTLLLAFALASATLIPGFSTAIAEDQIVDLTPIGSNMAIEKSEITMRISEDTPLPWAYVEGTISNPVLDYPVIIQIYGEDGSVKGNSAGGVHFAQSEVNPDGSYEYKFRVFDVSDNSRTNIFEGTYTVEIFKVVYLQDNLTAI